MKSLWKTHAPLTAVSLLMLAVLAACGVGLLVSLFLLLSGLDSSAGFF